MTHANLFVIFWKIISIGSYNNSFTFSKICNTAASGLPESGVSYFDITIGIYFRRLLGIFTAFISTFERCAQRLSPLVGLKQRLLQELWSVGQLYNYRPYFCSLMLQAWLFLREYNSYERPVCTLVCTMFLYFKNRRVSYSACTGCWGLS